MTRPTQPDHHQDGLIPGAGETWPPLSRNLAWLPVLLFAVVTVLFYWLDLGVVYESQALLMTLNILFCSSVSILVVYLAARSYQVTGSRAVLFLGSGALAFAITYLLAGLLLSNLNAAVTIHNTGVFIAGLCFLISVWWAHMQKPPVKVPVKARLYLYLAYSGVLVFMSLLTLGAITGAIQAFYMPDEGFTLLRQSLLVFTVVVFFLASAGLGILYRHSRTPFLLWYCLGMALIGLGMGMLIIEGRPATLLSWLGRVSQYLGGLYILVAIWSLKNTGGDMRIPLEKALKETEEKYRTIVEMAKEGIWMVDTEGKTTFVNNRMAEMLGVSREEVLGKGVSAFTDEEGLALARQKLEQRRQGINESHEYKFIRKDGSAIWTLVSSTPLHNKEGKFAGSMSMITDITERKQAEDALRASERDLSMAQSIAHLGLWVWDIDKNTLQWSDETFRIMGLSPQELSPDYDRFLEFVHPDDKENINRVVTEALNGTRAYDIEWRVLRRDGLIRNVQSQGEVIAENGKPARMIGTILDITERKLAEEALRASKVELVKANNDLQIKQEELRVQAEEMEVQLEELRAANEELEKVTDALRESEETARQHAEELEKLMNLVPAAIWVSHDPQCYVISGNKAANQFYEAKEGDNVSAGPGDIQQDTTRRFFRNGRELMPDELTMQEAAAKGVDVLNSELEVLLPSGRWMTILGNASPLRDTDGNVRGSIAAFVDITDRKRAEEELRTTLHRFYTILSSVHGAILLVSEDGRIEYANEMFCHYFDLKERPADLMGLSASEMIKKIRGAYRNPDRAVERIKEIVERREPVIGEEVAMSMEQTCQRDFIPLELDGKWCGRLWCHFDITERKRAEKELLEAKMQAELYLDLMGHDINNMHQIAIGYLELALEALDLDEGGRELIARPLETMQRSAKLIDNVRKLQRVRAREIIEDVVDLDEILDQVIREYRETTGRKIAYKNGSGSHKVLANELLYDVFANLVNNAIKHTGDNGTMIMVSVGTAWESGKKHYVVWVEDDGPGVPEDQKEKIFNRLQRGETKARGVGLGLYLVKSLVESYHGRVWVEDRVSDGHTKGSRFVVMLPAI